MRVPWYMQSTGHSSMHALSLTPTQGSAITYAITVSFLFWSQDEQRGMFAGSESAVPDAEKLLQGRQLDPGSPVRLAGRTLKAVDGLPVRGGDELWLARSQPVGELVGMVGAEIRHPGGVSSGGQICDQVSTVSWESFLLVPITPVGPRLIQPTTYWLRLPATRPSALGMVPLLSSNGRPGGG